MIRFGVVTKTDPEKCRVRVSFLEDGIESDWLPVMVQGSKDNKWFHIFDQDEHVACLMDENAENGVVVGAIYNPKETTDGAGQDIARVKFKDGTSVQYNRESGRLEVKVGQTILNLDKAKGFTINAGGQSFKAQMNQLLTQLQAETHPTPVGPTGIPINSPAYAQIQQFINLIFEA